MMKNIFIKVNQYLFFSVAGAFQTWAIMALHDFLPFEALNNLCFAANPPNYCSANHLHKLFSLVILLSIELSKDSFLYICPANDNDFFLILSKNAFFGFPFP